MLGTIAPLRQEPDSAPAPSSPARVRTCLLAAAMRSRLRRSLAAVSGHVHAAGRAQHHEPHQRRRQLSAVKDGTTIRSEPQPQLSPPRLLILLQALFRVWPRSDAEARRSAEALRAARPEAQAIVRAATSQAVVRESISSSRTAGGSSSPRRYTPFHNGADGFAASGVAAATLALGGAPSLFRNPCVRASRTLPRLPSSIERSALRPGIIWWGRSCATAMARTRQSLTTR